MSRPQGLRRDLAALSDRRYDLAVVGGGIFGISIAWEAASRGLSVALIERSDFCAATSANSYKMVHGGIRYMQHGDLPRIRESCRERSSLLRVAPHLVRPLPILVPTYRSLMKSRLAMRTAMSIYDLVTADRNRGISDPINRIPPGKLLSRGACLDLYPDLDTPELTGGALFHDGQMYNPTRLALSFLRSAVEHGAVCANYAEATGLLQHGGRVVGVEVADRHGGERLQLRAGLVVNAAGPWAQQVLGGVRLDPQPTFSRDAAFVVPRKLIPAVALAVQGATKDPDALLSRGQRHLFVVPWRDYTLVGVWHVVWDKSPDRVDVPDDDLQGFLDEINAAMPSLGLQLDDVALWNAGCVLFGENTTGARNLSYGKRSWIVDHSRTDRLEGLITVIGVRYTTARGVAERAVDLACCKAGLRPQASATEKTPVFGGDYDLFDDLFRGAAAAHASLAERDLTALLRNYGSRYGDVLRYAGDDPSLYETLPGATTLKAEIVHAIRDEAALKLSDVVFRRTELATGEYPGDAALDWCAERMALELDWCETRQREEVAAVRGRFRRGR